MKPLYIKFLLVLLIFSSCTKDDNAEIIKKDNNIVLQKAPLKVSEINSKIETILSQTNNFNWKDVNDHMLWSAVLHGNNILTIGYGQESENFSKQRSQRLIDNKNDILNLISSTENYNILLQRKKNVVDHKVINVMDVKIKNIETIIALRKAKNIRYIEPNGYNKFNLNTFSKSSNSGCNKSPESINSSHYKLISPKNAQVAWNFYMHNIPQAWNFSTGAGITIGLIDTGVSQSQSLLNASGFNDGVSNGRHIEKKGTFIDSSFWFSNNNDGSHDKCGHGTSMASTMAAPRNNDGMPIGVAYNCNLVAYRATEDVLLNDYHERKGVSQALIELADRNDVKIISMSLGWVWSIGNIKDAIKYAHSKGKLIFAAGGTSTKFTNWYGVTFPASMNEVVAITGVDNGSNYDTCDTCHSGSKIDFTIIMEGDNQTSKAPPVLGFNNGERKYTGGSSVATATTAGIAALVWSKHPNWNKDQVLNKLKQSADFYPNRNEQFGYGNINALKAVQ